MVASEGCNKDRVAERTSQLLCKSKTLVQALGLLRVQMQSKFSSCVAGMKRDKAAFSEEDFMDGDLVEDMQ